MNKRHALIYCHESGFTLIEVLIALALFSVILILVFSALHTTNMSWIASERQIEVNEEQRLVITFIKRELSQLVPLLQINSKGNKLVFKGDSVELKFVSTMPAHRGGGGLYLLTLQANKDLSLYYQIVTSDINMSTRLDDEKVKSQILISDIEDIEFGYFGHEKVGDIPAWHDKWEDQSRLPDLISIRIRPKDTSIFWPEVVVPIRTQVSRGQAQFILYPKKISS